MAAWEETETVPTIRQDPVHRDPNGQWYFYDESWSFRHGPYPSEPSARLACKLYAEGL